MLGEHVRKVRKEQGVTQEQLAASSGVGTRFIRELEQGKETCQINKVYMVLNMLGIVLFLGNRDD